jgi:putative transposase
MSQSLANNYVHIVFSTKNREPFIEPAFENELFSLVGNECNKLECTPIVIGGHLDHLHILCMLSKKVALMNLIKEVKGHSSYLFKRQTSALDAFYWQNGYGAFSVSPTDIDRISAYIANQKTHHQSLTFQDEYRMMLKKYRIEYDERYVWD